jgi:predicted transcriptional regulator
LQEQEVEPQVPRSRVGVVVILLVTSGLILPLASFGVPSASVPSPSGRTVSTDSALGPGVESHGNVFLDGVPPMFQVAPPAIVGLHQEKFGVFYVQCPTAESPPGITLAKLNDSHSCAYSHTQREGFETSGTSGPWQGSGISASTPSNGAIPRAEVAGETMLIPTPTSTISSVTAAVPKVWWDFFQRRSKFEIYVEILELMKRGPMTPFEVAFYARLNHQRTKEYTEFLAQSGYLQAMSEDGKTLYALTKEGLGFLERVESLFMGPRLIEVARYGYQRDF